MAHRAASAWIDFPMVDAMLLLWVYWPYGNRQPVCTDSLATDGARCFARRAAAPPGAGRHLDLVGARVGVCRAARRVALAADRGGRSSELGAAPAARGVAVGLRARRPDAIGNFHARDSPGGGVFYRGLHLLV